MTTGPRHPWRSWLPPGVSPTFDPPATTINALFVRAVAEHGSRLAIEYYGEQITYAELGQRAATVAAGLQAAGLEPGDRVALYLPNTPWHPIWFFGALAAGMVVTHLSPLDAVRELAHKLDDSGARLLVTLSTPSFAENAVALEAAGHVAGVVLCDDPVSLGRAARSERAPSFESFVADVSGAVLDLHDAQPKDLALLQYTGGTTGIPKAAMLTHRNLSAAAQIYHEWFRQEAQSGPDNSVLVYSPLFHILGLTTNLVRRISEGATILLRQRFDAAEAVDTIERMRVTGFGGVPTTWIAITQLLGIETRDFSSLNYAGSGGAPLSVELFRRVRELTGLSLRGGWGMTETSPAGTNIPAGMPDEKLGTIGIPLPGVEIEIVDIDDPTHVLEPGKVGEMRIRGPNVTKGYWNRPEDTAAAFVDGWFLTGDIARMDDDGWFYLVDRKKDLIVSSGFNVYPLVVENAIAEHPDVAEVIVIGVPDAYRGEAAKAFIVLRAGAQPFALADLHAFLADRIGRHELPRDIEFRSELPRTSVGKHSRRTLRRQETLRSRSPEDPAITR